VNLEVVRSRAARGTGDLASVGRFAELASGESERAAELVQALLELARPLAAPVDLWGALRPMVVLHNALAVAARRDSGDDGDSTNAAVTLAPRGDTPFAVPADPLVARIALATALDAAGGARTPTVVNCSIEARGGGGGGGRGQVIAMLRCAAPAPPLDDVARAAIERGGVALETNSEGIMLFFRAAGRD
jgi:hypothetical protein